MSAFASARLGALIVGGLLMATPATQAAAQSASLRRDILESQRRLEAVRAERVRLQREMGDLTNRVRDVSGELLNIEQQLSASRSALAEVEFQADATEKQIEESSRSLIQARERLSEGTAILQRRLRDIYKRGALNTVRVLLGADSFADLLTRYRYLRMIASYDRSLVTRVTELATELVGQTAALQRDMADLAVFRHAKLGEVAELRGVEVERTQTLESFRETERRTTSRMQELDGDESRLTALIGELETRRREAESRDAARGGRAGSSTADVGTLEWPIEGDLIYRFGRERQPNGTVLRWNGVGIKAPTGSPVQAVKDGTVVLAGPFEGYGPTVVLSHGAGVYTLYLYLEEIGVVQGREVRSGQIVGTVGGSDTPEGSHIEFQIRAPSGGETPQAMDPLQWLRPRGK
ncbi:MAG: peptidoglycan DD-metalloendopeptidase family protein [Gemmatimonadota bacterium]|nr:MAG: peptidoglycan DD-metalloendopeptidase family protein [Gemmatimonadota bacterium]